MPLPSFFKNKLLQSTGVYTLTNLVNAAVPFFLLPFFTRWLSPTDYGLVAMFGLVGSFLVPIVGLSVNGAIAQKYYEKSQGKYKNARYLGNGLLLTLAITFVVALLIVLLQRFFTHYLSLSLKALLLAVLSSFVSVIFQCYLSLLQVRKQAWYYGLLQITFATISSGLSLLLVGYWGFDWHGRVYASVLSTILISALSLWFLIKNRWMVFEYAFVDIRHLWNYGFPLIFHSIGGLLIALIDRLFIANMVSLGEAGLYTLAYSVCSVFGMLTNSFNLAFVPWLFEKLSKNDPQEKVKIVKFSYVIMLVFILIALLGTIVAPLLLKYLVGKSFLTSIKYFFWLLLGFAFGGMYYLVTNYVFYTAKTKFLAYSTLFSGLINVLLCYVLIKENGAIGAAQAFALSNLVLLLVTWVLANRCYKMPWLLNATN